MFELHTCGNTALSILLHVKHIGGLLRDNLQFAVGGFARHYWKAGDTICIAASYAGGGSRQGSQALRRYLAIAGLAIPNKLGRFFWVHPLALAYATLQAYG